MAEPSPYSFYMGERSVNAKESLIRALMSTRYDIYNNSNKADTEAARRTILSDLSSWNHPYGTTDHHTKLYAVPKDSSIHLNPDVSEEAIRKLTRSYISKLLCCIYPKAAWKFKGRTLQDYCKLESGHPDYDPCSKSNQRQNAYALFPPPVGKDWTPEFLSFWHSNLRSYLTLTNSYKLPSKDAMYAIKSPLVRDAIDQFTSMVHSNPEVGSKSAGSLFTNINQELAKNESAHDRRNKITYAARHSHYHGSANGSKGKDLKLLSGVDNQGKKITYVGFISSSCIFGFLNYNGTKAASSSTTSTTSSTA